MQWQNEVTRALKINYPIVQAPMLGVTTPEMVAAIANQGGLGSLPVGGLAPAQTADLIRQTKALTNKPFGVNLFAHAIPAPNFQELTAMQEFLAKLCADNQIPYPKQNIEALRFNTYHEQVQVLLDENIPVVSFTFGIVDDDVIKAFKGKGVVLIGTATTLPEALLLEEKEIDMITAQGMEAGGHRGTFLEPEKLPLVGVMSLVPRIASVVRKPILAAGGIYNGKTIKAAFTLGAQGVQIGTAFIASPESKAMPAYKKALQNATDTKSILTKTLSGRWARGLRNKLITEIEKTGLNIPAFPFQTGLTAGIRAEAQKQDNNAFTAMWAGQSAAAAEAKPTAEIFAQLIKQTEALN
ncbi:NAD(P)H-dependent flavin oxidoreductase [Adhaeribacter rhizoryzae]|uniref:Nitronate monooxygenase n=1 Tax=Adhaeribacter rhizoryzae TaxID=2607907 RepID=A0A5M6DFU8_9BACT|nr:nitronate monooxygenase [Adhaeribacter rhizoryzae]KAA5544075.1 nitronate monooxygenase [Adhaeribacter rhizoryzae]